MSATLCITWSLHYRIPLVSPSLSLGLQLYVGILRDPTRAIHTAPLEQQDEGFRENVRVESQGPVVPIPHVHPQAVFPRNQVSAVDPRPSGEPGFHLEPSSGPSGAPLGLTRDPRPRSDDAHLASENVEELGDLVQRPATQNPSDTSQTVVVLGHLPSEPSLLRARDHAPKLVAAKGHASFPDAILDEEDRPPVFQLDRHADEGEERPPKDEDGA